MIKIVEEVVWTVNLEGLGIILKQMPQIMVANFDFFGQRLVAQLKLGVVPRNSMLAAQVFVRQERAYLIFQRLAQLLAGLVIPDQVRSRVVRVKLLSRKARKITEKIKPMDASSKLIQDQATIVACCNQRTPDSRNTPNSA